MEEILLSLVRHCLLFLKSLHALSKLWTMRVCLSLLPRCDMTGFMLHCMKCFVFGRIPLRV